MARSTYLIASAAFVVLRSLAASICFACVSALLFVLEVVPAASAYAWRLVVTIGVAAFRLIGQLKPEYRESYDTHGLSLFNGRPA